MKNIEEFNEFYNVMDAIITSVFTGESSSRLYGETGIEIRSCTSMSQFSGVAMLLKSKERPQLPKSYAMYEMITSGIRAGWSTIDKSYAINTSTLNKENYESMSKVKGTDKYFASFIFNLDENNQYGGTQDSKMPFIGFIERKNPSVELGKNLWKKMDEETDPHNGYGFFATVSMNLPNDYHYDEIFYSPMIVKTAPHFQRMSTLQLK